MGYLKKYVRKYIRLFLLAVCFLSLEAACDLMQPTVMSRIVDVGIAGKNLSLVLRMGVLMLGITAAGAGAALCRNYLASSVSQRFGTELRFDLFKKIQTLSYENIQGFETASLVTRLTNDVTQTQNFVNGMMRIFVKSPLLLIGSVIMSIILDPKLSIILVGIVPVVSLIIFMNTKVGYPFFKRVQKAIDRLNGMMREYLSGVRVIRAFNRFDFEEERFAASNDTLAGMQTAALRVTAIFSPATTLVVDLGILLVLWLGGVRINGGSLEVGKVIAFINYMTQISSSLVMISMVFTMFIRARASAERIGEVMAARNSVVPALHPAEPSGAAGVEFENVTFSYTGNLSEPAVSEIRFSCRAGETVGVIGTTGSGKTTIANLIPRFYDVSSGCVKVNGTDVRQLGEHKLRSLIAVVPQKSVLFSGTILDNIRWGREDATQEQAAAAARAAQADEFISGFPEGYGTVLGQGGVNLSGGQKQRLSIARALIKDPEILILDDCTSAVDVITEAKIRESLRRYSKDLICILISQRISSVMSADRILVLDNGRIVGDGQHAKLLEDCPVYREIYQSQYGAGETGEEAQANG